MSEKETKRSKRKKEQKHYIEPIVIDDDERILHLNLKFYSIVMDLSSIIRI
jgi:hypothetical protein